MYVFMQLNFLFILLLKNAMANSPLITFSEQIVLASGLVKIHAWSKSVE